MKKQLTIVLLLVLGMIAVNAQTVIYKAGFAESTTTKNWDDAEYADVTDKDILAVWKMEEEILIISNAYNDKFVLTEGEILTDEQNGYAKYKSVYFDAFDKDGKNCDIIISYYTNGTGFDDDGMYSTRIRIAYTDIWYGYYCTTKSQSGFE